MNYKIVGILIFPLILSVYHLWRGDIHYAYGGFVGLILLIPLLHWLEGMSLPPNILYIILGIFIVVTALEVWYIRSRQTRGVR